VVIAPSPLTDFAPLYSEGGSDGVVTQFDKDDVEAVGLVKFDFLGLRTLTIIDWAVKAINARRARTARPFRLLPPSPQAGESLRLAAETPLDIGRLVLDDPEVYALLKKAQTVAVFQLEGRGMQGMLKDARPDCFEDIIALVSLYRPGPMELIPSFCARKQGRETIEYPDARVEPVLRETCGIMVYQEQVMQMAQIVGGYTLGGADLLRRAMGKKNVAEMAKQRAVFRDGAANNGLSAAQADAIFDLMEKFAGYGFNKSHAAAYALIAYQTAWLKVHYPAEFMAAVLSSDMDTDKVVNFISEARALGLTVLPPDVNASGYMFEALDPDPASPRKRSHAIRYGRGAVKGVGRGAVESLVAARGRGGPFRDLADFCSRVEAQKLNKRALEALILSGSMDALANNRASLMAQLPAAMRAAEQTARDVLAGQNDMFGAASPSRRRSTCPKSKPGRSSSCSPANAKPWGITVRSSDGRVARPDHEDRHLPDRRNRQHHKPPPPERQFRYADQQSFTLVGAVMGIRKQGDSRVFVQVEDFSGKFEAVLYREAWIEFGPLLTRDAILVFEGAVSVDEFAGGYRMRTQRISAIGSACERQARLLRVRLNGIDADFAKRLQDVLAGHRGGTTAVRLNVRNADARGEIELGAEWRVRATPELRQTLERLAGVLGAEYVFMPPGSG
jgi:DNA polymerase-3 subunit alpha